MPSGLRTALIVEDYDGNRELMAELLRMRGFHVLPAASGPAALGMLTHVRPSVILLDWKMPLMDGAAFLSALRSNPATREVPVVVVTADRKAKIVGAEAVVRKPFDLQELVDAVERCAPDEHSAAHV